MLSVKCEVWSVKEAVRSEKCEVWSVDCEVRSVKCGLWIVKCRLWSVKCEVWSVKEAVRSVKCGVWSLKFGLRRVQCAVWGVECRGKDTVGTGHLWTIGHLCLGNFRRRLARVYVTPKRMYWYPRNQTKISHWTVQQCTGQWSALILRQVRRTIQVDPKPRQMATRFDSVWLGLSLSAF